MEGRRETWRREKWRGRDKWREGGRRGGGVKWRREKWRVREGNGGEKGKVEGRRGKCRREVEGRMEKGRGVEGVEGYPPPFI